LDGLKLPEIVPGNADGLPGDGRLINLDAAICRLPRDLCSMSR